MFGYINVNRPELLVRELDRYREYYCGLCASLGKNYGAAGRMTLSYDMTYLAMLLCGLYEPELEEKRVRCTCRDDAADMRVGDGPNRYIKAWPLDYAADMNVLLTWHKCMDDWTDEKKPGRRALALSLSSAVKKIEEKYPEKCKNVARLLKTNSVAEEALSCRKITPKAVDYLSGLTGRMLGEIFAVRDDEWNDELKAMGFYLGKFIYYSDAYSDLDEDKRLGRFNPLKDFEAREDFEDWIHSILIMNAESAASYFELLPVIRDAQIMRNIIYSGIWTGYYTAKRKRTGDGRSVQSAGR